MTSASVSVIATNTFPAPAVVPPPPAAVAGVTVTQAPAAVLATTGSPAPIWYVLSGLAFVLGGLALYGSAVRPKHG